MPAKTKKKIGSTKLRKQLSGAIESYNGTVALDVILEMNDPIYYQRRVIELIRENEMPLLPVSRVKANLQLAANLIAASLESLQ